VDYSGFCFVVLWFPPQWKVPGSFMEVPDRSETEEAPSTQVRETLRSKVTKEFRSFAKVQQIAPKSDPLQWWASQVSVFLAGPLLYH
jgi:hypothetical protein